MSALTKNRDTPCREGKDFAFEAAAVVHQGGMVALDASGKAVPADSTGNVAVGVAQNPAAVFPAPVGVFLPGRQFQFRT